jgi:15-cis-phytoene synthase
MIAPGAGTERLVSADIVRTNLRRVFDSEVEEGGVRADLRGQLLRPTIAYAGAVTGAMLPLDDAFWSGALAVQLAHEASLVHDDIIDDAAMRRGEPTVVARAGVGSAVVTGDHLLTTAYRCAADTGSLAFARHFARAVERTVAGEIRQGRTAGRILDWEEYREIVLSKSGELLGVALAAGSLIRGSADAPALLDLGRRMGLVYQMVDDLLDYCPASATGKPPLADHRQRKWTWVLLESGPDVLDRDSAQLVEELHAIHSGSSPLRRCLRTLQDEVADLNRDVQLALPGDRILAALLAQWLDRARDGVYTGMGSSTPSPRPRVSGVSRALLFRVPALPDVPAYLAANSRSFRFASRFLPREERARIENVYAFCRLTDDLADDAHFSAAVRGELLGEWMELAARSYEGVASGIPLLDRVMEETAADGIPFTYAALLGEGMQMDLSQVRYETLPQLRRYTYRVASVVGLWITEIAGVREPAILERAAAMGHAMQLTNILRDVGEDLRQGRLYLPGDWLLRFGIGEADLHAMLVPQAAVSGAYRGLVEALMEVAESDYTTALSALHELPIAFRRPFAVAAYVYRGIHRAIRDNGYDNLRQRAHTRAGTKLALGAQAVWDVSRGALHEPALPPERGLVLASGRILR